MNIFEKFGKKFIWLMNSAVNLTVLFVLLLLLCVGSYSIYDAQQVYDAASTKQYEMYKPPDDDTLPSFADLQALNAEVFGWLTVNDTGVDYPLVQSSDNDKYIDTDVFGKYSMTGSLFLDYRNSRSFADFNSIIFGHHMAASSMFGSLDKFLDEEFFDTHKYGNIYYDGKDHGLEFFAFMEADAYDDFLYTIAMPPDRAQEYLDYVMEHSKYTRDIGVTTADRIVLLSTCSSDATNGRYLFVGRISEQLYPQEEETSTNIFARVSHFFGFSTEMKVLLFLLLLILLLLLIYLTERHKRLKRKEARDGEETTRKMGSSSTDIEEKRSSRIFRKREKQQKKAQEKSADGQADGQTDGENDSEG